MLADQDGDGVPDLFEQTGTVAKTNIVQTTQYVVDGKVYTSLDDLPAGARQKYEQMLGRWDANGNGIPDLLEGSTFGAATSQTPTAPAATPPAAQPSNMPLPTVVSGDSLPLGARLLIAGLAVALVIALAALFLMNR